MCSADSTERLAEEITELACRVRPLVGGRFRGSAGARARFRKAPAREDEDASAEAPCIAQLRAALVLMADTLLAGEPAARGRDRYVRARIAAVLVRFRQWRCGA